MKKLDSIKIKARGTLATNDADWEAINAASVIKGVTLAEYIRDTVVRDARRTTAKKGGK